MHHKRRSFFKSFYLIFAVFLLLFLTFSCSKETEAPAKPPHLKTQLVQDLFSALRQKNYEIALKRLDRLRELDPDNVNLQALQLNIQNNYVIQKCQDLLDKGKLDESVKLLNEFTLQYGQTTEFRNALIQLNVLKDISALLNNLIQEEKSNPSYSIGTKPYTSLSPDEAGIENLKADIDIAWVTADKNIDTLMAILEIKKSSDPLVSNFKTAMSQDWKNYDIESNYLNPNSDILVFRILVCSSFESKYKPLIRKITSYNPCSYRDMLSKAIMLNFAGEPDKSNSMLSIMKKELNVPDNIYKSWFALSLKNNPPDIINGLVRFPFLIYCNLNASIKAQ